MIFDKITENDTYLFDIHVQIDFINIYKKFTYYIKQFIH